MEITMTYITTYTGKHFNPIEPDSSLIDIRDIAHALSMICRGNGHVTGFFSVAQHCVYCAMEAEARNLSRRVILACLLHDAAEAYLSDVPRPLKPFMPQYLEVEEHLLAMIFAKYIGGPLSEEEWEQVKEIDDDLLYYDMEELLREPQDGEPPKLGITLNYGFVPFEQVENSYLQLFDKWR